MKTNITVTQENIVLFDAGLDNDSELHVGDVVSLARAHVHYPNRPTTYSIYVTDLQKRYYDRAFDEYNIETYMYNAYALNDIYTR